MLLLYKSTLKQPAHSHRYKLSLSFLIIKVHSAFLPDDINCIFWSSLGSEADQGLPLNVSSTNRGSEESITESQSLLVAEIMLSGMNEEFSNIALAPAISSLLVRILYSLSDFG